MLKPLITNDSISNQKPRQIICCTNKKIKFIISKIKINYTVKHKDVIEKKPVLGLTAFSPLVILLEE